MRSLCVLLVFFFAGSILAGSPAEAVAAAARDVAGLPPEVQPYTRYLSLYHFTEKELLDFGKPFAFHVNSLSREFKLMPPRLVAPNLLAVDSRWYGWDLGVWERLGDIDPYFHFEQTYATDVVEERYWPGGTFTDGKRYKAGFDRIKRKAGDKSIVAAPWLPTKEVIDLRKATYSEVPILRADWFFVQTAIQKNRVAGYYAWLNLKKRADFEQLTGLDIKLAQRVRREVATVVQKSGIAIRNRQVFRFGAVDAGYWQTRDALNEQVRGSNAINKLDGDFKHNAERHYGFLPNRLFAYYLCTDQGVQQDSAPDEVGADTSATNSNDGKIHIMKGCITCHVEGLRPIDDYARKLFRGAVKLSDPDYKQFQRLEQLYLGEYQESLDDDNTAFTRTLARLNGKEWTPRLNAKAYGRVWKAWAEDDVTPEIAARELGIKTADLLASFKRYASPPPTGVGSIPPTLGAFLQEPTLPILREHWEEHYGIAQTITRGYVLPLEVKRKEAK